MTRDDIIRMAREAGCDIKNGHIYNPFVGSLDQILKRFSALVAAVERKACAEICEEAGDTYAAKVIRMRDNSEDNYPA